MVQRWVQMLAAAAAALVLLGPPAGAQVPDPFARELAQRLARSDEVVGEYNYSRAAGPFAGGLRLRESRRFEVMLRAGMDYRIVGVCDARCRNLDIRVLDANGFQVGEDMLRDAVPTIDLRPPVTGVHTIEVLMPACAAAGACYFAFNVYSR
jgi:hypothetical protein